MVTIKTTLRVTFIKGNQACDHTMTSNWQIPDGAKFDEKGARAIMLRQMVEYPPIKRHGFTADEAIIREWRVS